MKLIFILYQVGVYIVQNVIIPIEIVRRKNIGSTSKFVYGYLKSYFEENNSFPTIKEIADDLQRSFQTVSLAIKELRESKFIDTVKQGVKNIYKFLLKDTLYKPLVDTSLETSVPNINKGFIFEAPKKRKIRIIDLDNLPCFRKNGSKTLHKEKTSAPNINKGFISKDNELDHIEYGDPEFLETSTCNHQYTSKTLYKNCPKEHENFKSVFESAAMLGMPKSLNNKLNDALLNFGLEYVKWTLELILFSTQREKIAEALVFNWRTISPDYNGSIVRTNL